MIWSTQNSNLAVAFNPQKNSLAFLRFLLAILVVIQHSYHLGNFGADPIWFLSNGTINTGSLAVHSFFIISGFLITRSYLSTSNFGRYLWHRILRIFPGFWVCLVVTAFVFAPIAYISVNGNISGYLSAKDSPLGYIVKNLFLYIKQADIANLMSLHVEKSLNGSLWTLIWEFMLYLAIALLGLLSILKKHRYIVFAIFLTFLITYFVDPCHCTILLRFFVMERNPPLVVLFLSGAIFWLYRDKILFNAATFASLVLVTLVAIPLNLYLFVEPFTLPYILFWLSINLPLSKFEKHADYSYGIYIYSFPIQQLLIKFDLDKFGVGIYFILSLLLTVPLALLSWHFIEKPCLQLKDINIESIK